MSYQNVKTYFESCGLGHRVIEREQVGATVEQAAASIGCEPERIAKAMSFLVGNEPILLVTSGDAKVDNTKYKAQFSQKAIMIPSELVEPSIGHAPGSVCPFGIHKNVRVFLDLSLKRFEVIYTAGGSLNSTVELSLSELELHANPSGWVDVCKGWHAE